MLFYVLVLITEVGTWFRNLFKMIGNLTPSKIGGSSRNKTPESLLALKIREIGSRWSDGAVCFAALGGFGGRVENSALGTHRSRPKRKSLATLRVSNF